MAARLHPTIVAAMEATGLPWTAEDGGKHIRLHLDGKLVGIVSRSGDVHSRTLKNTVAQIRRAARARDNG